MSAPPPSRSSLPGVDNAAKRQTQRTAFIPLEAIQAILLRACQSRPPPIPLPSSRSLTNGRSWTQAEDIHLHKLVTQFGTSSWALVADLMGNHHTRAQCSQRWRAIDPRLSRDYWTPAEDQRLRELVNIHGPRSWQKISSEIGTRNAIQCRYRFHRLPKKSEQPSTSDSSVPSAEPRPAIMEDRFWVLEEDREEAGPEKDLFRFE
jgi:hypothetical protein